MLVIGTPCYGGVVTLPYMLSMLALKDVLNRDKTPFRLLTPANDSLITRVRNSIVAEFLSDDRATHLLFIDADIGFAPELPWKYLEADKDVVCGIYPVKNLDVDKLRTIRGDVLPRVAQAASLHYAVKLKPGGRPEPVTGLLPVVYGATGFMMIRREVFTRLAEAYPELGYDYAYTNDDQINNVAFFETAIDPATRDYLPEDYAFCKRWTDIGGEIYADIHSVFTHVGNYEYTGNFTAFLTHLGEGGK